MSVARVRKLKRVRELRADARNKELAAARNALREAEARQRNLINEQAAVEQEIRNQLSSVASNQAFLPARQIANMVQQVERLRAYLGVLDGRIAKADQERQERQAEMSEAFQAYRLAQRRVEQIETLIDKLAQEEARLEERLEEMNQEMPFKPPAMSSGTDT
jgi:flagellar biosynthesis chaperone FliJ